MLDELDTYALSDFLLFSRETYVRLFELYNQATWPLHLVALVVGAAALLLLRDGTRHRLGWALLAVLWAWVGWAFHLERYATINPAAPYFALLFGLEATLLLGLGAAAGRLRPAAAGAVRPTRPRVDDASGERPGTRVGADDVRGDGQAIDSHERAEKAPRSRFAARIGTALAVYALVIHPLTGLPAGRTWTMLSFFGMAPDPTAIGTLGLLMHAHSRLRWIPFAPAAAWCVLSALTAYAMGSIEAAVPAAAVLVVAAALVIDDFS